MDFNVEARKLQLKNLNQFISSYKDKIQNVLTNLGWNINDTLQDNQFITCSLDPSHKVPQKVVDNHIRKCALRKEGYDLNEEFLSEPQSGPSVIHIDDHKKIEVLSAAHKTIENFKSGWNGQDPDPRTSDRLTSTFSTDERLALYDYAVSNTVGGEKLPEFDVFSINLKRDDDKPLSYEEKLALERDLKRRKIKYKSIHTSHKNHTEVLREVIEGQMELYRDWLNNTNCTRQTEPEAESSKLEIDRNGSSVISRNSSSNSRDTRRRHDEKSNEENNDSRSTSRKTSIDRESEKSMCESNKSRKRRSRSRDRRSDDRHDRRKERSPCRRRERSPYDYKRDRRKRSTSRDRRSKERRRNGYKDRRS